MGGKKHKNKRDDFSDDESEDVKNTDVIEEKQLKPRRRAPKEKKSIDSASVEVQESPVDLDTKSRTAFKRKKEPQPVDSEADPFTPEEIMWLLTNGRKGKQIERALTRDELEFMKRRKIPIPTRKPTKKTEKKSWRDEEEFEESTSNKLVTDELLDENHSQISCPLIRKYSATAETGVDSLNFVDSILSNEQSLCEKAWKYERFLILNYINRCQVGWTGCFHTPEDISDKREWLDIRFLKRFKTNASIFPQQLMEMLQSSSLSVKPSPLPSCVVQSPVMSPAASPSMSPSVINVPANMSPLCIPQVSLPCMIAVTLRVHIPVHFPPQYEEVKEGKSVLPRLEVVNAPFKVQKALSGMFDLAIRNRVEGLANNSIRRPPPPSVLTVRCRGEKGQDEECQWVEGFIYDLISQGFNALEDHWDLLANHWMKIRFEEERGETMTAKQMKQFLKSCQQFD